MVENHNNKLDEKLPGAVICNQNDYAINDNYWYEHYIDGLDIPIGDIKVNKLIEELTKLKGKHGDVSLKILGDLENEDIAIIVTK